MSEFAGSAAYLAWVYSGGTITLHADMRSFSWAPTINFIDATAGQDAYEQLIKSFGTGGEFGADCLAQAGGTVLATALARGTKGTVIYGPEGNTTDKLKYSIPAYSTGPQWTSPYNDVTTLRANWRQFAAEAQGAFT